MRNVFIIFFILNVYITAHAQVPLISGFTPDSGPIGTTVTITGTNFNPTAANNIVYFGASRATVTAATATQLIVSVPFGATYQPISVTTLALTAFSAKPFNVTFCSENEINASSFATPVSFSTGTTSGPVSIAVGDLDGDGKADAAVANRFGNTVSVLRNTSSATGNISFASSVNIPVSSSEPISAVISDLDGDGKLDLTVAIFGGSILSIFRNTSSGPGNISFAPKIDFPTGFLGAGPFSVTYADFDGDGKTDLAVANSTSNQIGVLLNLSTAAGTINFAIPLYFSIGAGTQPYSIAANDLDGDGKVDLTTANVNSASVSVFLNNSSGTGDIDFSSRYDFSAGIVPRSVSIGDLDGDNKPDLAVTSQSDLVSIFLNTSSVGNLNFEDRINFATGSTPWFVTISDLTGDGKPDLATANESGSSVSVLRNSSSGMGNINFSGPVDFIGANGMVAVASGDFDNDGKSDLVSALFNEDVISVFRNTIATAAGAPTITSFSPTNGSIGTTVTITGTNFSATPINNSVRFNGIIATVVSSTTTSITTIAPSGATTGPISISVGCGTVTSTDNFNYSLGELIIYNAISPNQDLKNEKFIIENIADRPDTQQNKVYIYNRWGDVVFEIENYDNDTRVFKGLNKNGNELPTGTYFFKIDFQQRPSINGYILLKR